MENHLLDMRPALDVAQDLNPIEFILMIKVKVVTFNDMYLLTSIVIVYKYIWVLQAL